MTNGEFSIILASSLILVGILAWGIFELAIWLYERGIK